MLRLVFAMIIIILDIGWYLFITSSCFCDDDVEQPWPVFDVWLADFVLHNHYLLFLHSANIKTSKSSVARCFELWCGWSVESSNLRKSFFLKICWQTLLPFPRATPYFLRMSSFIPWAPGGVKDFSQKLSNGICWHSIVKFTNNNCEIHYIQFWNSQA